MTNQTDLPILLGADLGYGSIKLSSLDEEDPTAPYHETIFQSFVSTPVGTQLGAIDGIKASQISSLVEFAEWSFYAGQNAHSNGRPLENLDYDRLLGSPEIRTLFYGALSKHKLNGKTIKLMIGLPMELLQKHNRAANAAAIRGWLQGEHTWKLNGRKQRVIIEDVSITTQAAGALLDYIHDEDGTPNANAEKANGEIGIASIGFSTNEFMVLRARKPVIRLTSSTTNGVRRLLRMADPEKHYTLGELDALRAAGGLDLSKVKPIWVREVHGDVEDAWGSAWERFKPMIWVGGGSIQMNGSRGRYEAHAHDPKDPVMSISNGLLKALLAAQRREDG